MSKPEIDDKFERKVKLWCVLHGNNFDNIRLLQEKGCKECRAKHGGICHIRYYKGQVVYNDMTASIKKIKPVGLFERKSLPDTELSNYRFMLVDGETYRKAFIRIADFCFGFLKDDSK
jgi:hypothetical protein